MEKERQNQGISFFEIGELICAVLSIVFNIIQFSREGEFPLSIFSKIFTFLSIIFFYRVAVILNICLEERRTYANSVRRLEEAAEKNQELRKEYAYRKRKYQKIFKRNCIDRSIRKFRMSLPILLMAIFIMGVTNIQNVKAYYGGMKDVIWGTTAEDEKQEPDSMSTGEANEKENRQESKEETSAEEDEMNTAGPTAEQRNMQWRFILDRPEEIFLTDSKRENQVFFYTDESLEDSVSAMKEQWRNSNKKGVAYKEIEDGDGNTFDTYTALEDSFKDRVKDAAWYTDMGKWTEHAPHSSDYDKYISGREELNQIEVGDKKGAYQIWWLLANDYLYFAQEYEMQTENVEAVSYYYINSIYCCMEALQYALTKEEYDSTFSFLTMRYHDICRYECIMPPEEKERAEQIYSLLVSDIK